MRLSALPVLHGLNISRSLSTSQGLHIWALTMRDPELSMSSDLENFLLRPGGCCQNRLLYRVTQCCFQAPQAFPGGQCVSSPEPCWVFSCGSAKTPFAHLIFPSLSCAMLLRGTPSSPSSSWAGTSTAALPPYLGTAAPTISALALAYTCYGNLPGRSAALSHPQLLCSPLMGCKPFPALTYSCAKSHPV